MQTDCVEAVHARLREWGARIQAAPHACELRGADGKPLRMTTQSFWDLDDCFLEINQRDAA